MDLNQSALRKQAFGKIVRMVVLVLLAVVFIVPIIYTVIISLKYLQVLLACLGLSSGATMPWHGKLWTIQERHSTQS